MTYCVIAQELAERSDLDDRGQSDRGRAESPDVAVGHDLQAARSVVRPPVAIGDVGEPVPVQRAGQKRPDHHHSGGYDARSAIARPPIASAILMNAYPTQPDDRPDQREPAGRPARARPRASVRESVSR